MGDYRKLRAFELADRLVLDVYRITRTFPREEIFGLTSQMRRSAVSIPSNIVEGSSRHSRADYIRYLETSLGSAQELEYQLGLSRRLGYMSDDAAAPICSLAAETCRVLKALIISLRRPKMRGTTTDRGDAPNP